MNCLLTLGREVVSCFMSIIFESIIGLITLGFLLNGILRITPFIEKKS